MLITMPDEFRTQTEDVTLRFRTTRPLGLLLTTNTEQSAGKLELALMGGRVRLVARMGDREKVHYRARPRKLFPIFFNFLVFMKKKEYS
jgi:hypothetical protein